MPSNHTPEPLDRLYKRLVLEQQIKYVSPSKRHSIACKFANKTLAELHELVNRLEILSTR